MHPEVQWRVEVHCCPPVRQEQKKSWWITVVASNIRFTLSVWLWVTYDQLPLLPQLYSKLKSMSVWHFLNHRLELSVSNAALQTPTTSYTVCIVSHKEPKRAWCFSPWSTLGVCLRFGWILGDKVWVPSSLSTVNSVWTMHAALYYFIAAGKDVNWNSWKTYERLAAQSLIAFVKNFRQMKHRLEELKGTMCKIWAEF